MHKQTIKQQRATSKSGEMTRGTNLFHSGAAVKPAAFE